ncbi:MAG: peptidylprolyl isomerase [Gammaproteobacteria bacterium]
MTRLLIFFLITITGIQQASAEQTPIDSIIVIVDEDIISQRELDKRIELIRLDFVQNNRRLPDPDTLKRQVLEIMIVDSILLQEAKNRGLKITDGQLNQMIQGVASQNGMNLTEFRQTLINEGVAYEEYRNTMRRKLTVDTLQRQYTSRAVTLSKAEVDDFINRTDSDEIDYEYHLAHILIALPDAASPEQVNAAASIAIQILERLNQGTKFDQLANEFSSNSNALQGGDLGWRNKAGIPSLFSEVVVDMKPGDFVGPLRSASGFHIVSLVDKRIFQQLLISQVRSRHILIKSNDLISEQEARKRLVDIRQKILSGENFEELARLYSVDFNSGALGGDIGWISPGGTVPEYEAVTNVLEPGQISEPFKTQFGWHIVEVTGRRTVDDTAESKRKKIEIQLLQQKQQEAFDIWTQRLRDGAYVVYLNAET